MLELMPDIQPDDNPIELLQKTISELQSKNEQLTLELEAMEVLCETIESKRSSLETENKSLLGQIQILKAEISQGALSFVAMESQQRAIIAMYDSMSAMSSAASGRMNDE